MFKRLKARFVNWLIAERIGGLHEDSRWLDSQVDFVKEQIDELHDQASKSARLCDDRYSVIQQQVERGDGRLERIEKALFTAPDSPVSDPESLCTKVSRLAEAVQTLTVNLSNTRRQLSEHVAADSWTAHRLAGGTLENTNGTPDYGKRDAVWFHPTAPRETVVVPFDFATAEPVKVPEWYFEDDTHLMALTHGHIEGSMDGKYKFEFYEDLTWDSTKGTDLNMTDDEVLVELRDRLRVTLAECEAAIAAQTKGVTP